MISYLQGVIHYHQPHRVVLLVQGVGYEVELPKRVASQVDMGQDLGIWVHQIIREDASDLYGFSDISDRDAYRLILKAPQVGPKLALAILDVFPASSLAHVGFMGSAEDLLSVKGLGPKLADRLIVDLKSWVGKGLLTVPEEISAPKLEISSQGEALQVLIQLGYKEPQVRKVLHEQEDGLSSQDLIKQALRVLSGRGV